MTTREVGGVPATWLAASVALGAAAAVVYTLSPLTVVAVTLAPILVWAATTGLPRLEGRWVVWFLVAAIALRVAAILVMLLAADHDTQAAAILTGDEAYALSRTLRVRNFLLGIPGLKYDYYIAFEEYGRTSYMSVLTMLQLLFGPSPYGLRLVNMLVFLAGAVLLFRFARAAFGPIPALIAFAVLLFLPTLFFWSISLLKESLYFLLSVVVLTSVAALVRGPHAWQRIAAAAIALITLWALRDMRPGAIYLVGGGTAVGAFLYAATTTYRRFAVAAGIVIVAVALLLARASVRDRLFQGIDEAAQIQRGHVFTAGHSYKTLDEGFYVNWAPDTHLTAGEAGRFVIRSLRSFLIEPMPWQMATRSELVFLPEHMLWYVAVVLALVGVVRAPRHARLATCLLIGIIIPTTIVVAMTNGNVGTLIRFRGLVWPYLLVLAAAGAYALLPNVERTFASSVAGRTVQAFGAVWSASVAQSRAIRSLSRLNQAVRRIDLRARFRASGVAVATFVICSVALLQAVPVSSAPSMPVVAWALAALVGITLIAAAAALARAWPRRSRGWLASR